MSAYEISLLSVIGLNVMLAVSLNMISGFCGQISLGHGAFYGARRLRRGPDHDRDPAMSRSRW